MSDIHIHRQHHLGLKAALDIAQQWAEQAEREFDMRCAFAENPQGHEVNFSRSGVNGTLKVTKDSFELNAKLGFLLGAFKDRIENEIASNLDRLLGAEGKPPKQRG